METDSKSCFMIFFLFSIIDILECLLSLWSKFRLPSNSFMGLSFFFFFFSSSLCRDSFPFPSLFTCVHLYTYIYICQLVEMFGVRSRPALFGQLHSSMGQKRERRKKERGKDWYILNWTGIICICISSVDSHEGMNTDELIDISFYFVSFLSLILINWLISWH